ncbi:Peptidase family M23 [Cyclonatronum proteinivorum]|uniref:Peptidase family M23 n=1 Tax=Cyclonatronum proteinivorum TaxID=1457365 RepID=A0A345UK65_9BACT|nr:M23 family metallopeptidase [Cyclonatronum proteinivorum]AXJ00867.1 Peptidase family M23 [Cyclonatronum proteinivorum]
MKNLYYYDPHQCQFVVVEYSKKDKILHTLTTSLLIGIVVAGFFITSLVYLSGSPAELALRAENRVLLNQHLQHQNVIGQLSDRLYDISLRDNEVYRTVLGMEPINEDERMAGAGGADLFVSFEGLAPSTTALLRQTSSELENIEQRLRIQQYSFDEVREFYNRNNEKMRHLPILRPIDSIILSGFGMRTHPVLGVRRMHEGLDFRASIGTPIYAPGDGVIKYAANRAGGYGLTIDIDHGHGYMTRYAHLSALGEGIRAGRQVTRGQHIGYTGRSGVVSGPHLHYEIHRNGRPVDPLNYLFADLTPQEYQLFTRIHRSQQRGLLE